MATAALAWALGTPTGHPSANLVLIQMAERTVHRFGNLIYLGSRRGLSDSCDLYLDEVGWALHLLARRRLILALDRQGVNESWVMFPRPEVDLTTLRRCWRIPVRSAPYRSPSPAARLAVYRRDGFRCVTCGWAPPVPADYDGRRVLEESRPEWGRWPRQLVLDHKIPRSAGGRSEIDNLQSLCSPCNGTKGARV